MHKTIVRNLVLYFNFIFFFFKVLGTIVVVKMIRIRNHREEIIFYILSFTTTLTLRILLLFKCIVVMQ